MPKGDKYTPGDLVFAKVKGYPPWPARVTGIASNNRYVCTLYSVHVDGLQKRPCKADQVL